MATKKTKDQEAEQAVKNDQETTREETTREETTREETTREETTREGADQEDMFSNFPNPCVYCGPSVRGVARQYTTYQGGIPEPLKEFIKAHPAVRALLVPTAKFAGVRRRLETPGTAEAVVYKRVKSEL